MEAEAEKAVASRPVFWRMSGHQAVVYASILSGSGLSPPFKSMQQHWEGAPQRRMLGEE
jgi:hypothetical protein